MSVHETATCTHQMTAELKLFQVQLWPSIMKRSPFQNGIDIIYGKNCENETINDLLNNDNHLITGSKLSNCPKLCFSPFFNILHDIHVP